MVPRILWQGSHGDPPHQATHPEFGPPFDAEKVTIEPYGGDDDRIGWKDVHIVILGGWG